MINQVSLAMASSFLLLPHLHTQMFEFSSCSIKKFVLNSPPGAVLYGAAIKLPANIVEVGFMNDKLFKMIQFEYKLIGSNFFLNAH